MGLVFEIQPGYAAQLPSLLGANPLLIDVAGFDDGQISRSVITQMAVQRGANVQFLHSLQDLIYVYGFGERVGQLTVAGLSFVGMCGLPGYGDTQTGIEYVLDWYELNRVGGAIGGMPLSFLIGGAYGGSGTFRGYLTDMQVEVAKPEARLASFGFQFRTLPQRRFF